MDDLSKIFEHFNSKIFPGVFEHFSNEFFSIKYNAKMFNLNKNSYFIIYHFDTKNFNECFNQIKDIHKKQTNEQVILVYSDHEEQNKKIYKYCDIYIGTKNLYKLSVGKNVIKTNEEFLNGIYHFIKIVLEKRIIGEEILKKYNLYSSPFMAEFLDNNFIVTLIDLSGKIYYQSPSVEKIMGFSQQEFQNKKISDIVHPEDIRFMIEKLNYVKNVKENYYTNKFDFRGLHKDGYYKDMTCIAQLINMGFEKMVMIISYDITKQKTFSKNQYILKSFKSRQKLYLQLIAQGKSRKEIRKTMNVTQGTVDSMIEKIKVKLHAKSFKELKDIAKNLIK